MADEGHLPPPLLQRAATVVTLLACPRPPRRRLLLADADQRHRALAARSSGRLQVRAGDLFPVIALGEADHRDSVLLGEVPDRLLVRFPHLAERPGGGVTEPALLAQVPRAPPRGLQVGHIPLQEDP